MLFAHLKQILPLTRLRASGVPYVTPLCQEWDGEAFRIVPRERAAWIGHIKYNPNISISCAEDSGTYKRITAQGKAGIVFGPAPM
jgi:nitroimidazol reductase NimA-like FMN-containing flavoprotein (pyridoxamine 5'-phosphate oxidase superfamily)